MYNFIIYNLLFLVFYAIVFFTTPQVNGNVIDFEQSWIDTQQTGIKRVPGKFGNAWKFYNSKTPVILKKKYELSEDFTLDAWINLNDCSGVSFIFSSRTYNHFGVSIKDGKLLAVRFGNYNYLCEYDFIPGHWYYIAVTYSKQKGIRAYINSRIVIAGQANKEKEDKNINLKVIGAYSINGKDVFDHYFHGLIDRPMLRTQYMNAEEIKKLYCKGINKLAIVPIPQQVFSGKGEPFQISEKVCICLNTDILSKNDPGIIELTNQLAKSYTVVVKKDFKPLHGVPTIILSKFSNHITNDIPKDLQCIAEKNFPAEGFIVSVKKDRIFLSANSSSGLFYAIQCVRQLLRQPAITPVDIYDYPTFPYRACLYVNDNKPPTKLDYHLRQLINSMAEYRINYIMLRIHDWVVLDQPEISIAVKRIADYAQKHHVKVIPYLQCYGHAKAFLWKDLRCGHTITVKDEPAILHDEPVALLQKNVIITRNTPIIVRNSDGKLFIEGRDYELISGELKTKWYFPEKSSFRWWWAKPYICKDNKPWKIKRLTSGRIISGQKVFITYDVASNGEGYCPFSEYTRAVLSETVLNIVKVLDPEYINLGMDEIWQPRGKGRCCSHNNMTAGETVAYEMSTACRQVKKISPRLKVMMFSDQLDEHQTPDWKTTLNISDMIINGTIDKRIIMMPWYYDCNISEALDIKQSTEWFLNNGYNVIGTAGVAPINIFLWGQYLNTLQGLYNTEGFTYTLWAASKKYPPLIGLSAYSQNSWSPAQMPLINTVRLRLMLDQLGIKPEFSDAEIRKVVKQKQSQKSPELKQLWINQKISLKKLLSASIQELQEMNFEKIKGIKITGLNDITSAIHQAELLVAPENKKMET